MREMMSEKTDLHNPFKDWLEAKNLKYTRKNWNNHNRQADDGFPDFSIPIRDAMTLYVEFKTKEKFFTAINGLSPKQIKWRDYLQDKNHRYLLTYKLTDAFDFVNFYIGENK
jgi:hypothetical protein